jgi:type II secretory ATPase GspE/PulE/Tfp pilus assembly ATPase PilB-like protein
MFDPSKLNLDLDNLDNEENNQETQAEKKSEKQLKNTENNNNSKVADPLENLDLDKNTKQNTSDTKEKLPNKIDTETKKETKAEEKIEKKEIKEEKTQKPETQKEETTKKETISQTTTEAKKEEKIIFDINLNSVETLLAFLITNQYDFFTIEPEEDKVKVNFFKDKILKETKYIKYPIYSQLIIKLKNLAKLKIDITDKTQE